MRFLPAADMTIGEGGTAHRAAQVRTRIAAFRELADLMREVNTELVLDAMQDDALRNAQGNRAAVDLEARGVPR